MHIFWKQKNSFFVGVVGVVSKEWRDFFGDWKKSEKRMKKSERNEGQKVRSSEGQKVRGVKDRKWEEWRTESEEAILTKPSIIPSCNFSPDFSAQLEGRIFAFCFPPLFLWSFLNVINVLILNNINLFNNNLFIYLLLINL